MKIRIIDFETTGMPENDAKVCEVGYTDLFFSADGKIEIAPGHAFLCNPGIPMPPEAQAVHHIGDGELADKPDPETILQRVFDCDADFYAAHNADFERQFCTVPQPWICTYKVALRVWPDMGKHTNQFLRYALPLKLQNQEMGMPPHRACPDTYVTAYLLAAEIESGKASIDDMVRWSNGPALLPRVNFGKHKGSKWEDVSIDYLQWVAEKSDLDRDIKANARHWIKVLSK